MRWLRRRREPSEPEYQLDPGFADMLSEHALMSFERQLDFSAVAGERDWSLDLDRGMLALLPDMEFAAQVLGSVSYQERTWLWAWANETIPGAAAEQAVRLRSIGAQRNVGLFNDAEFDVALVGDGHLLSLACTGLLPADAYYRCPYEGGEAVVVLEVPGLRETRTPDLARVVNVVATAVQAVPLAVTPVSVEAYLAAHGLAPEQKDGAVIASRGAAAATFEFDELGRLSNVSANLGEDTASGL